VRLLTSLSHDYGVKLKVENSLKVIWLLAKSVRAPFLTGSFVHQSTQNCHFEDVSLISTGNSGSSIQSNLICKPYNDRKRWAN